MQTQYLLKKGYKNSLNTEIFNKILYRSLISMLNTDEQNLDDIEHTAIGRFSCTLALLLLQPFFWADTSF